MFCCPERLWYAVRVKSNREWVTAEALRGKNYEVLLPRYREYRSRGTVSRPIELPLFPGYLFCRLDVNNRIPVMIVPGVVHIVGIGRAPAPVDPQEMAGVLAMVESSLDLNPFTYPAVGERVRVEGGPLRGVEGTILAHKGTEKLVVSVSLLQRSMAVDMDRNWVATPAAAPQSTAY